MTQIIKPKAAIPAPEVVKEVKQSAILEVIRAAIKQHEEAETSVPLHVVVRGAIALDQKLDVSSFTMLGLLDYLMLAYEELPEKPAINSVLIPLTTEYVLHTVGVEPWTHKDATLKIINSLLNVLK